MTLARLLRPLLASVLLVALGSGPARAQSSAPTFDAFYVFGDSLADNGNVWLSTGGPVLPIAPPPSGAYFQGRFSNGPVAFEYLWQRLTGARPGSSAALRPFVASPSFGRAVNFAFGGTGSDVTTVTPGGFPAPGLLGQVDLFRQMLGTRRPSRNALYAIVTGANDYGPRSSLSVNDVTHNIALAITQLHGYGARNIVVLTLPDLGCLPPGDSCNPASPASQLTAMHNTLLTSEISQLQLPGANVKIVDVNVVFSLLRSVTLWQIPALDVLVPPPSGQPPTSACLFIDPATCPTLSSFNLPRLPAPQFLFWDVVHPTTDAHRILGEYLYVQLRPGG